MKSVCVAMLVVMTSVAPAQTIYRCGPDGRELSQKPCAGGQPVTVRPAPSEQERADAQSRVDRELDLGERMEKERARREATESKHNARAAGFHPRPAPSAASAPRVKKRQTWSPGKKP